MLLPISKYTDVFSDCLFACLHEIRLQGVAWAKEKPYYILASESESTDLVSISVPSQDTVMGLTILYILTSGSKAQ